MFSNHIMRNFTLSIAFFFFFLWWGFAFLTVLLRHVWQKSINVYQPRFLLAPWSSPLTSSGAVMREALACSKTTMNGTIRHALFLFGFSYLNQHYDLWFVHPAAQARGQMCFVVWGLHPSYQLLAPFSATLLPPEKDLRQSRRCLRQEAAGLVSTGEVPGHTASSVCIRAANPTMTVTRGKCHFRWH